ncbi:MAG: 2-phospho-L-lactate guanylyltransferase [Actinomycetota bacterium]|nr:2-phospho-L-lactate guanylyltransferase [Actinomycetota bacterium]
MLVVPATELQWTVLVPMKALPAAKSRLAQTVPAGWHVELVAAIRADTLRAVRAAARAARVLVITDVEDGISGALVQSAPGLNGALRDGADHAGQHWPRDGVAALVGDLPALRPEDLDAALVAAAGHAHAFVSDAAGTGTTLLTATPGTALAARFGTGSAARHAAHAVALDASAGLRHDVDSVADLASAAMLGVGPATRAVLDRARLPGTMPA